MTAASAQQAVVAPPEMKPDIAMAGAFLSLLAEGEPVTFQTFDDGAGKDGRLATTFTADLADAAPRLTDLNSRGSGVFWMVNCGDGHGRRTASVTGVRALFVDLDGAPLAPVENAALEPHAVVESSPGRWHAYWLVDGVALDKFKPAQLALAKKFGGDTSVHDLPRVMRLPGFWHRKGEPVQSVVRSLSAHQPYKFADFVARLGLDLSESPRPVPTASADGMCGAIPPGGRHAHLGSLFGALNRRGASVDTITAALMAENAARCVPPLEAADVANMVSSMLRRYGDQHGEAGPLPPQIDIAACIATDAPRKAASGPVARSAAVGGTAATSSSGDGASEVDDEELGLSATPKFSYGCCPGVLERFIRSETQASEVVPVGLLVNVVTRLSADVGRSAFVAVGRKKLHLSLWGLIAGPSGRGRKSTTAEVATLVRQAAFDGQPPEELERMNAASTMVSLSTAEGLIRELRTTRDDKDGDRFVPPGLEDNRRLLAIDEFAQVLHRATTPNSTLSPVLRSARDGATLQNASAGNPMRAERPHVALVGNVPDSELVTLLSTKVGGTEVDNGLINRHLIAWMVSDKIVPHPKPGAQVYFDQLAAAYRLALRTAWGGPRYTVAAEDSVEITLRADAEERYTEWYIAERKRVEAPRVAALMVRQGDVLKVYAGLLALLRGSTVIEVADLEAGLELLAYWRSSIEFLFGQGKQTAEAQRMHADAVKLLGRLTVGQPTPMREIKDAFEAKYRRELLDWGQRQSPPLLGLSRIVRPGVGRPTELVTRLQ